MKAQWWAAAAVAVVAATAGYLVARSLAQPVPLAPPPVQDVAPEDLVGRPRPGFLLRDADGQPVAAERFDGESVLLNFWASWCAPCVEEMPMLSELQADYAARGLRVVGVAVDQPERARAFSATLALDYLLLFGEAEAALASRRYGNAGGMLPYTVLIDPAGVVRWTRLGAVTREELETQLASLRGGGGG